MWSGQRCRALTACGWRGRGSCLTEGGSLLMASIEPVGDLPSTEVRPHPNSEELSSPFPASMAPM